MELFLVEVFSKEDYKFWNEIPEWCQAGLLARSPVNPKPAVLNRY